MDQKPPKPVEVAALRRLETGGGGRFIQSAETPAFGKVAVTPDPRGGRRLAGLSVGAG